MNTLQTIFETIEIVGEMTHPHNEPPAMDPSMLWHE